MLHLHEEGSHVLSRHILLGREEVKPVIWPPGYIATLMVAEVGVTQSK